MAVISRRECLAVGLGAMSALTACGRKPEPVITLPDPDGGPFEAVDPKRARQEGTLDWAVAAARRSSSDRDRDKYRHPIELLTFFDVKPNDTVVDLWPGAGYMTEILGPYLTHGKGRYVAALFETNSLADKATAALIEGYRQHFSSNKTLYGAVEFSAFGPSSRALVPSDTADVVLILLVVQDLMAAGIAEKAFADAFQALKPGGTLGVEQHRADIGNVQDPAATNGYVQEPFVKQLAAEAGFQFVASSEINANPKDDKDHPFGVWTLPPQRLTAPRGQPPNPEFDGTLYESIGESDRMVLKFRKPQ
ncbi:MAG: class I SAM-dependent methyltransferase [Asticcacaulis sp.]|nr:class I SAM-dependent methyltransferase [Asticcacaulis sp.]